MVVVLMQLLLAVGGARSSKGCYLIGDIDLLWCVACDYPCVGVQAYIYIIGVSFAVPSIPLDSDWRLQTTVFHLSSYLPLFIIHPDWREES